MSQGNKNKNRLGSLVLAAAGLTFGTVANALPILTGTESGGVWSASDAEGRSAEATFDLTDDILTITLSNTSDEGGKVVPNEVLVGLVFGFTGEGSIVAPGSDSIPYNVSAALMGSLDGDLSELIYDPYLDGEYAYGEIDEEGLGNYAITASAYDPLAVNNEINPLIAYDPDNVGGADFGIVNSEAESFSNAITYWVVDTLVIQLQVDGSLGDINEVSFLYGTDYERMEVPEPATLSLLGGGLLAFGLIGRRRRKMLNS